MKQYFHNIYLEHRGFWNRKRVKSLLYAILIGSIALAIQHFADHYVSNIVGIPVNDLILDHVPTVDIDFFVIQGALILTFLGIYAGLTNPKSITFTIKSLAVFIVIRSFLISLTHLGIQPEQLKLDTNGIGFGLFNMLYNTTGDFFFSGHTGIPFLLALIFWNSKIWRYTFFTISFILGASVLLAHIHYSIDVFAAPFITYSIYVLSTKFFKKDYEASQSI